MPTNVGHVAIFWDFANAEALRTENCRPPSNVSGYTIVQRIREVAQQYGRITTFRGYTNLSELSSPRSVLLRSELQCSGLSLIDCPHNGRKNVVDEMIIVDMLTYAIDNDSEGLTMILISGDRDFAYPISVLRLRMYQVVLISPSIPCSHLSLRAQASACLDWNAVILANLADDRTTVFVESSTDTPRSTPSTVVPLPCDNNTRSRYIPTAPFRPSTDCAQDLDPVARVVPSAESPLQTTTPLATDIEIVPPVYTAAIVPATDPTPIPTSVPPSSLTTSPPPPEPVALGPIGQHIYAGLKCTASPPDEIPPCTPDTKTPVVVSAISLKEPETVITPEPPAITKVVDTPPALGTPASPSGPDSRKGAATSSAPSRSDVPGDFPVPAHFQSLVTVIQNHQQKGIARPLRSKIAVDLIKQDPTVYHKAGAKKFSDFSALAVEAKVVVLGEGKVGADWIALRSDVVVAP
ncbi:hypothetical protein V5O48_018459 [Marasmius crinis-equi]|uniref:NYN domain-containing protein n=1 Tax=Marasmius crinis-equi TaxID=585013 RepID=A0ABR3EL87_9AGAR